MSIQNKPKKPVYPYIADQVLESVAIPVVSHTIRDEYVRPDTLRLYVSAADESDSDEEERLERERNEIRDKYKNKTIKKVVDKTRSETGQVTYKIIWTGRKGEAEFVPSKGLQDHPDWALVEAFEYYKAKHGFMETDRLLGGGV